MVELFYFSEWWIVYENFVKRIGVEGVKNVMMVFI